MHKPLKVKPEPYVHFRGINCGCEDCREPAVAQFHICALKGWVAVCKYHDLQINFAVLRAVMPEEKADLCIKTYHADRYLLQPKSKSSAASKLLNGEGAAKQQLLIPL